ncbi:hypothetical protein SAMN05216391_109108 [Lachnospiraceae bacterium KHCPX20]|nr:hypothetical protein SAMN05216391_109108 [Lachnospiraceae bacterium KHCPX20]
MGKMNYFDQKWYIEQVLNSVQQPIVEINYLAGRANEVPEDEIPRKMMCRLNGKHHLKDGTVRMALQKKNVVFFLEQDPTTHEVYFSENNNPKIVPTMI